MNSKEEQLLLLKNITRTTGMVHSAQTLQLELWGYLTWMNAKPGDLVIRIDLENRRIIYDIVEGKQIRKPGAGGNKMYLQRLNNLNNWVKWLLGDDWIVEVTKKLSEEVLLRKVKCLKKTKTTSI